MDYISSQLQIVETGSCSVTDLDWPLIIKEFRTELEKNELIADRVAYEDLAIRVLELNPPHEHVIPVIESFKEQRSDAFLVRCLSCAALDNENFASMIRHFQYDAELFYVPGREHSNAELFFRLFSRLSHARIQSFCVMFCRSRYRACEHFRKSFKSDIKDVLMLDDLTWGVLEGVIKAIDISILVRAHDDDDDDDDETVRPFFDKYFDVVEVVFRTHRSERRIFSPKMAERMAMVRHHLPIISADAPEVFRQVGQDGDTFLGRCISDWCDTTLPAYWPYFDHILSIVRLNPNALVQVFHEENRLPLDFLFSAFIFPRRPEDCFNFNVLSFLKLCKECLILKPDLFVTRKMMRYFYVCIYIVCTQRAQNELQGKKVIEMCHTILDLEANGLQSAGVERPRAPLVSIFLLSAHRRSDCNFPTSNPMPASALTLLQRIFTSEAVEAQDTLSSNIDMPLVYAAASFAKHVDVLMLVAKANPNALSVRVGERQNEQLSQLLPFQVVAVTSRSPLVSDADQVDRIYRLLRMAPETVASGHVFDSSPELIALCREQLECHRLIRATQRRLCSAKNKANAIMASNTKRRRMNI